MKSHTNDENPGGKTSQKRSSRENPKPVRKRIATPGADNWEPIGIAANRVINPLIPETNPNKSTHWSGLENV